MLRLMSDGVEQGRPKRRARHACGLILTDAAPFVWQVSTAKMGMLYGIFGMTAIIVAFWVDTTYTYDDGVWLVAVSMVPGAILGVWSAAAVEMTGLPEMVGLYNVSLSLYCFLRTIIDILHLTQYHLILCT
jgi:NAD/NADP transhydrogenase beta subunit